MAVLAETRAAILSYQLNRPDCLPPALATPNLLDRTSGALNYQAVSQT
jgi:hypothetical protein